MEGDGPSGGDPKFVGVIGASFNPYALDMAMCDLSHFRRHRFSNY